MESKPINLKRQMRNRNKMRKNRRKKLTINRRAVCDTLTIEDGK